MKKFKKVQLVAPQAQPVNADELAKARTLIAGQTEALFALVDGSVTIFTAGNPPDEKKLELIDLCIKCREGVRQLNDFQLPMTLSQLDTSAKSLCQQQKFIVEKLVEYKESKQQEEFECKLQEIFTKVISDSERKDN